MAEYIYETRFDYYVRNPFYKMSQFRYEIKKILSEEEGFYIDVKVPSSERTYKKADFSYNIKIAFKSKEELQKRGRYTSGVFHLNKSYQAIHREVIQLQTENLSSEEKQKKYELIQKKYKTKLYKEKKEIGVFEKRKQPNGLLILTIRTKQEVSEKVIDRFKAAIEVSKVNFKTERISQAAKQKGEKQKLNRTKLIKNEEESYKIDIMSDLKKQFHIGISSPLFYKKTAPAKREVISPYENNWERKNFVTNEEIVKDKIHLERQIKESILKRYKALIEEKSLDVSKLEVLFHDFNNVKVGYVELYKENKYKRQANQKMQIQKGYITEKYVEEADYQRQKIEDELHKKDQLNFNSAKLNRMIRTRVKGLYNFDVEFKNVPKELLIEILLHGIGGKGGLGMGYLHENEK